MSQYILNIISFKIELLKSEVALKKRTFLENMEESQYCVIKTVNYYC